VAPPALGLLPWEARGNTNDEGKPLSGPHRLLRLPKGQTPPVDTTRGWTGCRQPTDDIGGRSRVLAARGAHTTPARQTTLSDDDDGLNWAREAASEAEGRQVSLTATVTATTAAVSALGQPQTVTYSRTSLPELGTRST
jgi:hypothetical protein